MLIYETSVPATYRTEFIAKVKTVSSRLGIDPNWLMAIMYWESAHTFSPSITNSIGATGLIQFMPATAADLGTTTAYLRSLTAVQQLDWVEKYFRMWYRYLRITAPDSYVSTYLIIFYPNAVNKGLNYVIPSTQVALQNPAFDKYPKDGKITVSEISRVMLAQLPSEWIKDFSKKKASV